MTEDTDDLIEEAAQSQEMMWREELGMPVEEMGKSTPEGVPDDYEYLPPDEEPGDGYEVVTSDRGGRYVSPDPVSDDDEGDDGVDEAAIEDAKDRFRVAISEAGTKRWEKRANLEDEIQDMVAESKDPSVIAQSLKEIVDAGEGETSYRDFEKIAAAGMREAIPHVDVGDESVDFSPRSSGDLQKMCMKAFFEEHSEHQYQEGELSEAYDAWSGSSSKPPTLPIWEVAVDDDDVEEANLPQPIEGSFGNTPDLTREAMEDYIEFSRDVLREMFGDSITVSRGISGTTGRNASAAADRDGSAEIDHREIASWTINSSAATGFARSTGVVVTQEVDIEDVYGFATTGAGFKEEMEVIVAGGDAEYEYTDSPPEDGQLIDSEYDDIDLSAELFENDLERLMDE